MNPLRRGAEAQEKPVFHNGVPCLLREREQVVQGLPGVARWAQEGVAEKVGAVILAPLTLVEGAVAGVGYLAAYPFLSEGEREKFKNNAIGHVLKGKKNVETHERNETAARYETAFGFDPRIREDVQTEVQNALDAGNRVKSMDGSPHEYIVLNNSAIILIPNGKIEDAYVRTIYNGSTGKPFVGEDFDRALKVIMELHDSIVEQDGNAYAVWLVDLTTKQVRVLDALPDDINASLDGRATKVLTNIDAKRYETCLNFYDPDKTEGKSPLKGRDTRRERDGDRAERRRPAPRNDGVQPPLVAPARAMPPDQRRPIGPGLGLAPDAGRPGGPEIELVPDDDPAPQPAPNRTATASATQSLGAVVGHTPLSGHPGPSLSPVTSSSASAASDGSAGAV